jgi:hypothetical protein
MIMLFPFQWIYNFLQELGGKTGMDIERNEVFKEIENQNVFYYMIFSRSRRHQTLQQVIVSPSERCQILFSTYDVKQGRTFRISR